MTEELVTLSVVLDLTQKEKSRVWLLAAREDQPCKDWVRDVVRDRLEDETYQIQTDAIQEGIE